MKEPVAPYTKISDLPFISGQATPGAVLKIAADGTPTWTGPSSRLSLGSPALGAVDAVHAAMDGAVHTAITAGITSPAVPRNVTATTDGTATDIKAVQVIVTGTNVNGDVITETLPVFTADSKTTVVGNLAFATVTSFTIPAHDGTGCTTSIGTGAKLGLGKLFATDTILAAYLAGVREGTRPTVAVSATLWEANTVALSTALAGTAVLVDYYLVA